jgi:hypothetical protein
MNEICKREAVVVCFGLELYVVGMVREEKEVFLVRLEKTK